MTALVGLVVLVVIALAAGSYYRAEKQRDEDERNGPIGREP